MTQRHLDLRDYLLSFKNDTPTILDIGAGSGGYSKAFSDVGCNVVAVEPYVDLSELSEACTVIRDGWPTPQVADKTFDIIICVQVLEHIWNPVEAIRAIISHLAPDGLLYLEIPSTDWILNHAALFDIHLQHQQYFTDESTIRLLQRCGGHVVEKRRVTGGRDAGYLVTRKGSSSVLESKSLSCLRSDGLRAKADRFTQYRNSSYTTALYGVGFATQAFLGWNPAIDINKAFDDTPDYWGNEIYSVSNRIPVLEPTPDALGDLDRIIISSYVHDRTISDALASRRFRGSIVSLRPATAVIDGPPSLLS